MTHPWERVLLAKRENIAEWSKGEANRRNAIGTNARLESNTEIQQLLKLPCMLPEAWVMEVGFLPLFFDWSIERRTRFRSIGFKILACINST